MPRKVRDYADEYKKYQGTPEQRKKRAQRNAARRKMEKEGRVHKGDQKDIDHKSGLAGGNGDKNLRVQSKHENRSYPRNKDGSVKKRKK